MSKETYCSVKRDLTHIVAGADVMTNMWWIHRNPAYWSVPLKTKETYCSVKRDLTHNVPMQIHMPNVPKHGLVSISTNYY